MDLYIVVYKVYTVEYYCIWYTNDKDGFKVENNSLICFSSTEELKEYCKMSDIIIKSEKPSYYDIDYFIYWLNHNLQEIECRTFLNFWNIVGDTAYSICEHFYGDEDGEDNEILYVYNQLFYGTNPEAMRSEEDELYYPKWDDEDMQIIKNVVKDGLRILSKALNIDLSKELKDNE